MENWQLSGVEGRDAQNRTFSVVVSILTPFEISNW